jgi:hypothetical protein
MLFLLALGLLSLASSACVGHTDCGSANNTAPGLCLNGVCQCGYGYSPAVPIDPSSCNFVCAPPLPSGDTFLNEPEVVVTAIGGE